jgi:hypothetical protein
MIQGAVVVVIVKRGRTQVPREGMQFLVLHLWYCRITLETHPVISHE